MRPPDAARLALATLCVLIGCAPALDQSGPSEDTVPPYRPRRDIERYRLLDTVVLEDGDRRWIVSPTKIIELSGTFFQSEYRADEGISGSITAVAQDDVRLWIGTSRALHTLEKDQGFVYTYLDQTGLDVRFVAPLWSDYGLVLMSRGAAIVDATSRVMEVYPSDFDIREVTDVVMLGEDMWVGTTGGLRRFSVPFKQWSTVYGTKALQRATILRLAVIREVDPRTGRLVPLDLYAMTTGDVFVYRSSLDTWERVGF